MSTYVKPLASGLVIIACLAFIGFLVHEKVDGAYALALATVPIVIAFFTRPPDKKDPPGIIGGVIFAGAISVLAGLVSCSAPTMAAATQAEAAYREEQRACLRQYKGDDPKIDACRAKVREAWDKAAKDGGS